jgi:signal transduction histidine kinase
VLINLIRNAREAMPSGGQLTLQLARDNGGVILRVIDRGEGMTEEQHARIFDLFYTTKAHGTGLGLPLSQQIVAAHGGSMACESAVGQGTTFKLWFPAAQPMAALPA